MSGIVKITERVSATPDNTVTVSRIYEEPGYIDSSGNPVTIDFSAEWDQYQLMRRRVTELNYNQAHLYLNGGGFVTGAQSDIYCFAVDSGLTPTSVNGNWVDTGDFVADDSIGITRRIYKWTDKAAGQVDVWGADGVWHDSSANSLPPLFAVPAGVAITSTHGAFSWQVIGGGSVSADISTDDLDGHFWNDFALSASTSATEVTNMGTLNAALAAASGAVVWDNTGGAVISATADFDPGQDGTFANKFILYAKDPASISMGARGKIRIARNHCHVVGFQGRDMQVEQNTSIIQQSADVEYMGVHDCSFARCSVASVGASTFHYIHDRGPYTAITRFFGGFKSDGNSGNQAASHIRSLPPRNGDNTVPLYAVYRDSWFQGDVENQTDVGSKIIILGTQTGTANLSTSADAICSLLYENLYDTTTGDTEPTSNKASKIAHFNEYYWQAIGGGATNRGGDRNLWWNTLIDGNNIQPATGKRLGGMGFNSVRTVALNTVVQNIWNTGTSSRAMLGFDAGDNGAGPGGGVEVASNQIYVSHFTGRKTTDKNITFGNTFDAAGENSVSAESSYIRNTLLYGSTSAAFSPYQGSEGSGTSFIGNWIVYDGILGLSAGVTGLGSNILPEFDNGHLPFIASAASGMSGAGQADIVKIDIVGQAYASTPSPGAIEVNITSASASSLGYGFAIDRADTGETGSIGPRISSVDTL